MTSESIHFFHTNEAFALPSPERIKTCLFDILKDRIIGEINIIFCDDEYLLEINKQYLGHHYYTDIITFELEKEPLFAELYISTERVKDNAVTYLSNFYTEIHRIIIHGALHLVGHSDQTIIEKEIMRRLENAYLDKFFGFE